MINIMSILLALCLLATTTAAAAVSGHAPQDAALPNSASRAAQYAAANNYTLRLPMRRRKPLSASVRDNAQKGFVQWQNHETFSSSWDDSTTTSSSSARPSPTIVKSPLNPYFKEMAYGIKLWIGNPPQLTTLDFDTGSSETWVSPQCSGNSWNPAYEKLCRSLGIYVPEQSESVIDINSTYPPQYVSYGSGEALLTFYKDTISFTDVSTVESEDEIAAIPAPVQFGLAKWSSGMMSGIFGAGYGIGFNQNYSGIIDEMHSQGMIRDKDFGVAVGSVDENGGEVLFGGIDMAKFTGPLHPIENSRQFPPGSDSYYRYWVNVTYIGVTQPGSCLSVPVTEPDFNHQFLPDTGTTMTYLPYNAFQNLLKFFPDAIDNFTYGTIVDCGHLNATGTIDFGFNNFTIHVPYKEFIFELEPGVFGDNNDTLCILGAVPAFDDFLILGDTFMRSVYALFRQKEHKIYFGQYSNCGENVISTHGISGFTGDCGEDGKPLDASDEEDDPASSLFKSVPVSSVIPGATATATTPAKRCTSRSTGTYIPLTTSSSTTDDDTWTTTPYSTDTYTDTDTVDVPTVTPPIDTTSDSIFMTTISLELTDKVTSTTSSPTGIVSLGAVGQPIHDANVPLNYRFGGV
ncbi:aspartic peptidase domain-containing protein [Podospora fimiseda]|uniref:Aspartic peptidase domain-containing protein n=1 Tax=Podospora fimiseda TaxID=252190 RepID=A0AAN6YN97_9PEZI|nr:aspartic peptidase domain-containing protein [Podospora fimiseda]